MIDYLGFLAEDFGISFSLKCNGIVESCFKYGLGTKLQVRSPLLPSHLISLLNPNCCQL